MGRHGSVEEIIVEGEGIRLGQFLQLSQLVDTGGNAKEAIARGAVSVNGTVERRRGCQLQQGDLITFEERTVRVRY